MSHVDEQQVHKMRGSPLQNICLRLAGRETNSRRPNLRATTHLPLAMSKRLDKEFERIPSLVQELGEAMEGRGSLRDMIKNLSEAFKEMQDRHGWVGKEFMGREWFVLWGGADMLTRLIQAPTISTDAILCGFRGRMGSESSALSLKTQALQLLRDLCYTCQHLSEQLSSQECFVVYLFHLMRDRKTFDEAVSLCEEVLAFRGEVFSLSYVPDVEGLIRDMSKRQLAFFCRVLALVVFETDDRASETLKITPSADLLMARREQVMLSHVKPTDRNHAVLLGISELLPRMTKLVVRRVPMTRMLEEEILAELPEEQYHELLALMGLENDSDDWAESPSQEGPGWQGANQGLINETQEGLKTLALLSHQVEVLFVMCTLLAGKRKTEVQVALLYLGIVPALLNMFDGLDWRSAPAAASPSERIHGPGCECNPESAMRIQYLRLVHNLCDMDFDHYNLKHQLVSQQELESVSRFAAFDDLKHAPIKAGPPAAAGAAASPSHGVGDRPAPGTTGMWVGRGYQDRGACEHYNLNSSPASQAEGGQHDVEGGGGGAARSMGLTITGSAALAWEGIGGSGFAAAATGFIPRSVGVAARASCLSTRRMRVGPSGAKSGKAGREMEKGLISKILQVFMRETPDSSYRFWLAACVEAFIRGSDSRGQVIMAKSGMLRHLVEGVLNSQCSGNLQTNFDLLGELIKWNPEAFAMFNDVLDGKTYSRFMQVVVSNLVDSNVFIRSVVLSLEYFASRQAQIRSLGCAYDLKTCKLWLFLKHNSLHLLRDLMTVISVDEVNQENVCCLNTALSFCIFARQHGLLDDYVASIREWEMSNSSAGKVTGNFLSLVKFWQRYYLYRGKDGFSLEVSSNIPYSRWREIVAHLIDRLGSDNLAKIDAANEAAASCQSV